MFHICFDHAFSFFKELHTLIQNDVQVLGSPHAILFSLPLEQTTENYELIDDDVDGFVEPGFSTELLVGAPAVFVIRCNGMVAIRPL